MASRKWVVSVIKSDGKYVAFDFARSPVYYPTDAFEEALIFTEEYESDNIRDTLNDVEQVLGGSPEAVELDVTINLEVE